MGYLDRLRALFNPQAGAESADTGTRSPLEQELVKELQERLTHDEGPGDLVRLHLRFTGEVQGVGFRWTNQGIAGDLHLAGWVKNLDDGSVDLELQGAPGQIIRHLDTLHASYRRMACTVWLAEREWLTADPTDTEFEVRF